MTASAHPTRPESRWRRIPWSLRATVVLVGLSVAQQLVSAFLVEEGAFTTGHGRPSDAARIQLQCFSSALETYVIERRALPRSLDDLTATGPLGAPPCMVQIPLDPWGMPYRYTILDERRRAFEVRSGGPDETLGTGDDVVWRVPHED